MTSDQIPAEVLKEKRRELAAEAEREGRPADRIPTIIEGRLAKWYESVCLLDQPFRDTERRVRDLITEKVALLGENIRVARFARMAVGESTSPEDGAAPS